MTIKMQEGRHRKERRMKTSLEIYLPLLYCKGSKGLLKGCMWEDAGDWTNFIFWPHCYDRHVVSFLFSCCSTGGLGFTLSGVSESPLGRVCPSLPHLVSTVRNSAGNCFGTQKNAIPRWCTGRKWHIPMASNRKRSRGQIKAYNMGQGEGPTVPIQTDAPEESDLWTAWQLFPLDDD